LEEPLFDAHVPWTPPSGGRDGAAQQALLETRATLPRPENPRLSVVIPAFNEAHYLGRCLESLLRQATDTAYEVIVVDNASTDATAAIARSYGASVVTESRQGVCHARQAGLREARGEFVVSTDADTIFPEDWLSRIERSFTDTGAVAAAGPVRFASAPPWAGAWTGLLFWAVGTWARIFGRPPYASACNLAFRRAAFGGYNTSLTQGGDELAVLRDLKAKGSIVFDPANRVETSARRVVRGFVYNVVVTFLLLYLVEYGLSRLTNRSVFGSYRAFRDENAPRARATAGLGFAAGLVIVAAALWGHAELYRHAVHLWRSVS
jgi:glycosyltransferase involved in cell wall biosynthesis